MQRLLRASINVARDRQGWRAGQSVPGWLGIALLVLSVATGLTLNGAPVITVVPSGHDGFDVYADGALAAPLRLAANGAIVADLVKTNASGFRLTSLRAKDSQAVTFAPDDFVSITLPSPEGTNPPAIWEPVIQFKLTLQSFNTNKWLALFPGAPAPFHFLVCSMPTAKVWHQRGWLNATPVADPFPLLQDVHTGTPELSCLWNRNWGYLCPLGGHPIPMIGLWDPDLSLYAGYDFQGARVTDGSERYLATAYCWQQNASSNFIALAYPYGGSRFGQQAYPHGGEVLASWFYVEIDNQLPSTEDPNERFQQRLFDRYTNALPPVPAMNDLGWLPGAVRLSAFPNAPSLTLYASNSVVAFHPTNTVELVGWRGHNELPFDTAVNRGSWSSIASARLQMENLLTNYAQVFTAGGDTCLYWTKPLVGSWYDNWGGTNVTTLHESEGWYAARVLVELYRYDLQHGINDANHLQAIDRLFNGAKHFVWSRNEFDDVPSSPFAIGATLCSAFLLDYYFTFRNDPQRAANAVLALRMADTITWRYLPCWAMDSDRADAGVDSTFLIEPNSGRDWAALACANEVHWNIDSLTQVYVHTGDTRLRYYLRGILQRWPTLYRTIYFTSLDQYGGDALTEGYGVFDGAGPGRGGRYDYGSAQTLPLEEPIGASRLRIVAGAQACIAFDKGGTDLDVADYRTDGNGNCSFRIVAGTPGTFDVSFSYPYVDISRLAVTRQRGTQVITLNSSQLQHPSQAPSSLYFVQLQGDDVITVGSLAPSSPVIPLSTPLAYTESAPQACTNGQFVTLPLAGDSLLPQDWTNVHSFAGLVPGLHWTCGVPYVQRLHATSNLTVTAAAGAYAVVVAYSTPEDQTLTLRPQLLLDNGDPLPLSGQPMMAWRAWPMAFSRMVLLDYALVPPGRSLAQVDPAGTLVMGLTAFTGNQASWQPFQQALTNAAADFQAQEQQRQMLLALQASFSTLPANRMALLPLNKAGAPANFAALTGLNLKWRALTEAQLVDGVTLNATNYPLAFYLGDEHYVKTVITNGDGKAAIARYLAQGGTLVVLASGPFPFYYGDGPNDQAGASDPLLPALGLPIYNAFEQPPIPLSMLVTTNKQSILHSVPAVFPFPTGDQRLRAVKASQVSTTHRYVPWLTVTNFAGTGYGEAACFIEFGSGSAKGGKVLYIWSTLLSGPQGQSLMADAVSWIVDAVLRPPPARFNSIFGTPAGSAVLGFDAQPNLDYTLQYANALGGSPWWPLMDFGSSPMSRSLSVTNAITGTARFYRLGLRP